jgi:hypothetical protein
MPVFLWCIDMAIGLRLGFLLLISSSLNSDFKLVFHTPRPTWIDPHVRAFASETSFGIPSGHAQNSISVWGGLANSSGERWLSITLFVIIFFIGFSRLYNGVHFPTDVLAGWVIGGFILWIFLKLESPVLAWFQKRNQVAQLLLALGVSLFFVLLGVLARLSLGTWTLPLLWVTNAAAAAPGSPPINPLTLTEIISDAGALFGLAVGAILLPAWGGFNAGGPLGKRALRFLIGVIGVLIFWRGLALILPGGENTGAFILRYLRYALTGFWITGIAPVVFTRLRLAEKSK